MEDHLTFRFGQEFVDSYSERAVPWGFPCGAGNSLGELTWLTKYSRLKDDGTKERWHEGVRRMVEGVYTILKNHCLAQRTPWNHAKAARAAEDMYDRLFSLKWTPPGRGMWLMGAPFIYEERSSAALQNCAFISTESMGVRNPTMWATRMMEMSMLGVGVGFDTLGAGKIQIHVPSGDPVYFVVPDSREGWCESVDRLLRSFFLPGQRPARFDYSRVRPSGAPLKRFGGTASGPAVLQRLHETLTRILTAREGRWLTSVDITDVYNLIGKCVVAGSTRRSATLALGQEDDKDFLNLKNFDVFPERNGKDGWGWMSNNSVTASVGGHYEYLAERISDNGEPGLFFLDLARSHGRLSDPRNDRDYRVKGTNPCAEQTLEDGELCTLVETFPMRHGTLEDFLRTLKCAYLYAKAVTLMPTHWAESNEVMTRNRRIGCSVSGMAQFADHRGWPEMRTWLNAGYEEIRRRDVQYSEWLGVRESVKMTSVKPSGTVSLVAGATPGVHWPEADNYLRRMRFRHTDPMLEVFVAAGYEVEPDYGDPHVTAVVTFPTQGPQVRSNREVSLWEKGALAAALQSEWADNSVSATFSFLPEERKEVGPFMRAYAGKLKSMSFLPMDTHGYQQAPYERVPEEEIEERMSRVRPIDYTSIYLNGVEPEGERGCANDVCELPPR
jgi:ribonucleoside-triphosphate reductase (thioredoxin)